MFAWALALKAGWNDTKVERLLSGCSQYAAIASIADCVPLLDGTRNSHQAGSHRTFPDQGTKNCKSCSKPPAPIHHNPIRETRPSALLCGSMPPVGWSIR